MADRPSLDEIVAPLSNKQEARPSLDEIVAPIANTPGAVKGQNETMQIESGSPLSFTQRLALSFAGPNAENVLKRNYKYVQKLPDGKFAVGHTPESMQPVDPPGLFNDVAGDVADVANWVAPVTLSTTLGTAGIAAGPGSSIAMAGLGMGMGELINQQIGRDLGVRGPQSKSDEVEAGRSTIAGAAGQGLGLGAEAALGGVKPLFTKGIDKIRATAPEGMRQGFDESFAKMLRIVAGVKEEATAVGQKVGFTQLFSPKNLNKNEITGISQSLIDGVKATDNKLGTMLDDAIVNLGAQTNGRPVVPVAKHFENMASELKDIRLLSNGNFVNKNYPSGADRSFFQKLFSELGARRQIKRLAVEDTFGQAAGKETISRYVTPPDAIPVRKLVSLKREFSSEYDKLSPQAQRIYTSFMDNLMGEADQIAQKVGNQEFIGARADVKNFRQSLDTLRQGGLDISNLVGVNNFLSDVISHPEVIQNELRNVNNTIGNKFLDRAEQWSAAQNFKLSNPNALKLAALTGSAGFFLGGGNTSQDRAVRGGIAAMIAFPGALPQTLKFSEALGGLATKAKQVKMTSQINTLMKILGPTVGYAGRNTFDQSKG